MATTTSSTVRGRPARVRELRALVLAEDYCVDPRLVAEAVLRRVPRGTLTPSGARTPSGRLRPRGDR